MSCPQGMILWLGRYVLCRMCPPGSTSPAPNAAVAATAAEAKPHDTGYVCHTPALLTPPLCCCCITEQLLADERLTVALPAGRMPLWVRTGSSKLVFTFGQSTQPSSTAYFEATHAANSQIRNVRADDLDACGAFLQRQAALEACGGIFQEKMIERLQHSPHVPVAWSITRLFRHCTQRRPPPVPESWQLLGAQPSGHTSESVTCFKRLAWTDGFQRLWEHERYG